MLSLHDPAGVPILPLNHFGDTRERLQDTRPIMALVREPWRVTYGAAFCALHQLATMFHLKNRWLCVTISRHVP
jgi:hypothetical protein